MAESRRLRTQAERDADGTTWRQIADSRPGYATYPQTRPGDPSWLRAANPALGIRVTEEAVARAMADSDCPAPVDGEKCAKWCGFCHLGAEPVRCGHTSPGLLGHPDLVCTQPDGHDGWHCDAGDTRWTTVEPEPAQAQRPDSICSAHRTADPGCPRCRVTLPAEPPPADRSWIEMECAPPRRRWWHRYTRRNP